jgi:3-dehydroquinate synthase
MRAPLLLAFGGGVVGDLTGLAAAVFRRGVPYVQLPTTLLAQVDSAIGGKVGVDLPAGKNLVGAFYQPRLVWNNTRLLASLPPRQRRSGLSEIIKYGAMADARLFAYVEQRLDDCLALKPAAVAYLVRRCAAIKADIVSRDERETTALRATLNFGHTLGHALEAATAYRRWTHGEAIAIGMCAAAALSAALGQCAPATAQRLQRLIAAAGLPTIARNLALEPVWQALRQDKKFIHGRPRWVILKKIGQVVVTERVAEAATRQVVRQYVRAR